jgi:hypothetical protein
MNTNIKWIAAGVTCVAIVVFAPSYAAFIPVVFFITMLAE